MEDGHAAQALRAGLRSTNINVGEGVYHWWSGDGRQHEARRGYHGWPMARALVVVLALSLSGLASTARIAAAQGPPSGVDVARPAGTKNLRVEAESVSIVCKDEAHHPGRGWTPTRHEPSCTLERRYQILNPGPDREEAVITFNGNAPVGMLVTVDGTPSYRGRPVVVETDFGHGIMRSRMLHREAVISAAPGSRHEVVIAGPWKPFRRAPTEMNLRHILFSPLLAEAPFILDYQRGACDAWQGDPRIDVQVTYPSDYRVETKGEDGERIAGWQPTHRGATTVLSRSFTASELSLLRVEMEPPAPVGRTRGILLGLGVTSSAVKGAPARGRIGYEVSVPDWLMYSLTFDTDFRRRFIVTPLVEAATPTYFLKTHAVPFLPSVGFGAGVPIQVGPEVRAGLRLQGDVHVALLGFVASVDMYPRMGDKKAGFVETSLLIQIGL